MKDNKEKKGNNNAAKAVILGAGAVAGIATAVALMDKKNRKNIGEKIDQLQEKGDKIKEVVGNVIEEKLTSRPISNNPVTKNISDKIKDDRKN